MNETSTQETSIKAAKKPGIGDLLKNRNFRNLWTGQSISDFGDSLTNLTLLILVNQLTGSAAAIATMLIMLAIPHITFGLLAGVFVDRWDRRRVMIASDAIRGVLVLGFILVGSVDTLWLLYLIAFLQASVGTLFTPARSALMPSIVGRDMLMAANSLSQTSRILFNLLGTAAAGVIVGLSGNYWVPFVIDALTFFLSLFMISLIVVPAAANEHRAETGNVAVVFKQLREGIGLILHTPALSGTMVATMMTMLGIGAVNVLIIPLIVNDLKVPVTWFGAVEVAQTAAMILSGSLITVLAARLKPTNILSGALSVMGLMTIGLAFVSSIWHLFPILFVVGLMMTPMQASISTLMQTSAPPQVLGRVGAALNTLISTASLVSMAFAGALGELIGVRNVFVVGGIIVILAGVISAWMFRGYKVSTAESQAKPSLSGGAAS
ncbi:MAG: MFS transporter [Chloroflexota bacterium]|nr:MFS transporter [Chloroflexota bacterium]